MALRASSVAFTPLRVVVALVKVKSHVLSVLLGIRTDSALGLFRLSGEW